MPGWSRRAMLGGGLAITTGWLASPALAGPQVIAPGLSSRRIANATAIAQAFMARFGVPGFSVAYGQRGDIVYRAAFGSSGDDALSVDNRFRIASVSKTITAAALMLLREAGSLSMGDRVFGDGGILGARYPIPDGAQRDWLEAITIDQLMTHTSGGWTNDRYDPMFTYPDYDHDQLIAVTLEEQTLVHQPGTAYAYSNFGYCLLGRVIEQLSGVDYADYVMTNVLGPSGAGGMEIGGNTLADRRDREVIYDASSRDPYGMNIARMDSHGGWIASAEDLVRFGMRVDGYRDVPDLVNATSFKILGTPSRVNASYAHGWMVNPHHRNRWHNGALPGTVSQLVRVEGDVTMAGLCNARGNNGLDTNGGLDRVLWDIYAQVIG